MAPVGYNRFVEMQNKYKGKKVLVTGGTGFIGLNLVKALKEAGAHLAITCLKTKGLKVTKNDILSGVMARAVDIRDRSAMEKIVKGKDYIFHLAGHSGAVDSMENPILDMEVNCRGSLNLLEACRRFNPEAPILTLGSRLQFGRAKYLPVDEDHPLMPTSIHGVNKLVVEKYFILYHQVYRLKTVYLRVTNPYGPYQSQKPRNFGIVNLFIQKALRDETIKIFGRGKQLRDYLYIDDLIEAMMLAALNPRAYGEVFNIGSGKGTSLLDMVRTIIGLAGGGKVSKVPWPPEFRKVETGDFVADIGKAGKILGWQPCTGITEGLKKTLASYR